MKFCDMEYQNLEAGLHFGVMQEVECPSCGPRVVTDDFPSCSKCGWDYEGEWSADQEGWKAYVSAMNSGERVGANEFRNGWDMFMLPKQGVDPDKHTAYSAADFEQKLRKTNVNQDGVTTWDGKPPRYLSPDERSPW